IPKFESRVLMSPKSCSLGPSFKCVWVRVLVLGLSLGLKGFGLHVQSCLDPILGHGSWVTGFGSQSSKSCFGLGPGL
uniref:Uncharacterized protein n=1 Tax=Cannabis sativa TaxID=3483 RepID=A0A803PKT0_CANSA